MKKIVASFAVLGCCYAPILSAQTIDKDPTTMTNSAPVTQIQPPEKPGVTPSPGAPAPNKMLQIRRSKKAWRRKSYSGTT